MSFWHSELDIHDDGFIRVSGENMSPVDNAVSNGSGKSSLWESIVWALTGETIRGTKQVSNLYGEDGTYVSVEFSIDNKNYCVIRSKDHCKYKTSLQIFIDGQDCSGKGIRDSEKLLSQYLPDITANLLGSVIILGQGLPDRFTNNSPSGRKEVLEKLSKSDFMIDDVKSRVANRKATLSSSLSEVTTLITQGNSKKELLKSQIEKDTITLSNINIDVWEDALESKARLFESVSVDYDAAISEATVKTSALTNITNAITDTNNKKMSAESAIREEWATNKAPTLSEVSELTAEVRMVEKLISDNDKIKDICPTCGQKLPNVFKPDSTELRQKLFALQETLKSAKTALSDIDATYTALIAGNSMNYQQQLTSLNETLEKDKKDLSAIQDSARKLRVEYDRLSAEMSTLKSNLAQADQQKRLLADRIAENNQEIVDIDTNLLYYISQQSQLNERLSVITKFDTLIKRDFRGYLLSNVIDFIEKRSKEYSKVIFDTEDVAFELNGNNIDISYQGKQYENLSGGEKQKVDIIVQFSIRDMLCAQVGFSSNILVLDEVFDGLDSLGCQRVISMITNLQDVRNVFIVTHRKDLSIPCDKDLTIIKSEKGISRIKQ